MNQRLLIALLTAFGFAAGFAARMLTETECKVPPAPAPGTEFMRNAAATPATGAGDKKAAGLSDKDREKFVAEIEKVRPQIDAYHKRMDEIAGDFDRDFVALLTPEQKQTWDAQQKKNAENKAKREAKEAAETGPLSDQQIEQLRRQPLWNALWAIAVTWRLDRINHDYKLDDAQQAKVRALLEQRRQKFLSLVDSTPPPSITYSELARTNRKLVPDAKK
jgi:hypothetical protein